MPYPARSTQSDASKRTAAATTGTSSSQYYTDKNTDPSVSPSTPKPVVGSVITVVGPANNSVWALNPARHAAGVPVVPAGSKVPYTKNGMAQHLTFTPTKVLSYKDTQNKDITKNYTFVNRSVKIKGADGKDLYYRGYYIPKKKVDKKVVSKKDNLKHPTPPSSPQDYSWNLPPHKWSLPVLPSTDKNFMPKGYGRPVSQDRYRRGRIWWKVSDPAISIGTSDTNADNTALTNSDDMHRYGFQFVWNPETLSESVAINMDVAPQAGDRFLSGPGYFPATEVLSITIRLDRTNDFACAAGNFDRPTLAQPSAKTKADQTFVEKSMVSQFVKYYRVNGSFAQDESDESIQRKLVDLYQRGTLADLEFLFRAINGSGSGKDKKGNTNYWTNTRGVQTADIGFLIPTGVNFDLGPMSFVGYVAAMSIEHGAFTQDMIPIRTDVTLSIQLLANMGLTKATS